MAKGTLSKFLFGFVIPVLVEVICAILVSMTESGASAEGFAYVVVLVMLMIAIPITLIGNIILVPGHADDNASYLLKGMVLPAIFMAFVLIYHTGIWDKTIRTMRPYLSGHAENIRTAESGPTVGNTYESFFVIETYGGSAEEQHEIDVYAREYFIKMARGNRDYLALNVWFYFVPRGLYDPKNNFINRERAVAVFRHISTDGSTTIEKLEQ